MKDSDKNLELLGQIEEGISDRGTFRNYLLGALAAHVSHEAFYQAVMTTLVSYNKAIGKIPSDEEGK